MKHLFLCFFSPFVKRGSGKSESYSVSSPLVCLTEYDLHSVEGTLSLSLPLWSSLSRAAESLGSLFIELCPLGCLEKGERVCWPALLPGLLWINTPPTNRKRTGAPQSKAPGNVWSHQTVSQVPPGLSPIPSCCQARWDAFNVFLTNLSP